MLVLAAACAWSCGEDRLNEVDTEALSVASRHQLSDDVARSVHSLQVMISFLDTSRALVAGVPNPGDVSVEPGTPIRDGAHARSAWAIAEPMNPSCLTAEWASSSKLDLRLLASNCQTPSGDLVDGLIDLSLGSGEFAGARSYTFNSLHVGETTVDGSLTTSGKDGSELALTGDLRFVRGSQSTRILATSGRSGTKFLWSDIDGVFASSAGDRFTLEARGVDTSPAACFPDHGTVQLARNAETWTFAFESTGYVELRSTLGLAEMWPLPACP